MEKDKIIKTLADKEVLNRIPNLSQRTLEKYRYHLKKKGVLQPRQRLSITKDVVALEEIIKIKEDNNDLLFSTIIDKVFNKYYGEELLINTIFSNNSIDARVSEKFNSICDKMGIEDKYIEEFWESTVKITSFLKLFNDAAIVEKFNKEIDILIAAIVGRNL